MILSDYLSRQEVDNSNPYKIIPISFDMRDILQDRYYSIKSVRVGDKYMVQTRSQAKDSRVNLPGVHGVDKGLDPHIRPERQTVKPTVTQTEIRTPTYKPRAVQGITGLRRKVKTVTPPQPKQVLPSITERQKPEIMRQPQVISQTEHVPSAQNTHRQPLSLKIVTRQFPSYPDLYLKPPPRPINLKENRRNLTDLA